MNLLVVVLGAAGSVLGLVLSARQILSAMKRKAVQDAEQTKAVQDNTAALNKLAEKFDGLGKRVDGQDARLDDHDRRLANGHL